MVSTVADGEGQGGSTFCFTLPLTQGERGAAGWGHEQKRLADEEMRGEAGRGGAAGEPRAR